MMKVNANSFDKSTYDLIKKSLDASVKRNEAIANNISNVNTKNYKRQHVTFEETLKDVGDNLNLNMTDTSHIAEGHEYGEIKVEKDKNTSMGINGNNVDIDNEMTNLAANTLKYNSLISQVNSRISMERYVISGGR